MSIEMKDLDQVVGKVVLSKTAKVSSDNDSKLAGDSRSTTLEVDFEGVSLRAVFMAALAPTVIKWARGARAKVDLPSKVRVSFAHAGAKDPKQAMLEKAATMSAEALEEHIAELRAIAKSKGKEAKK